MQTADVFVLDDDQDVADSMRDAILAFCKQTCLVAVSFQGMVDQGPEVLRAKVAILDINLGADRPSGLDAFEWLRDHQYSGKVVFLTGHALNHPLVRNARQLGNAHVVQKPIELDALVKLLES